MERDELVVNTLVFLEDLKLGIPQSSIMDILHELGIKNVEIRREFIKDFNNELINIKEKSKRYGIKVFYSVPEWIYKQDKLRVEDIETYFKEAYQMNCYNIKLNIGEVKEVSKEDIQNINELCEKYQMKMTVENDQTIENGRVNKIYNFLCQVKQLKGNISFTFDVGNWIFQDEDPLKNAELLKSFVTYIHLKDIGNNRSNALLNDGLLDWKNILSVLPPKLPIVLEYPCGTKEQLALEINKILEY